MGDIEGVAIYDDLPVNKVEDKPVIDLTKEPVDKTEPEVPEPDGNKASDLETEARKQGWRPSEDWKGDPTEWRSAEVFLERGKYFHIMKDQKEQIATMGTKIDNMAKYQKDLRLAERQKVLKELAEQKIDALEREDFSKVVDIDEEIISTRQRMVEDDVLNEEPAPPQPAPNPVDVADWGEFVSQNRWYETNKNMRAYADIVGLDYKESNPQASTKEILSFVQNEVETRFLDEPAAHPASPVANNSSRSSHSAPGGGNKKRTVNDLDPMQLDIGRTFVAQGAFNSIDEYIASLEEIGGLN